MVSWALAVRHSVIRYVPLVALQVIPLIALESLVLGYPRTQVVIYLITCILCVI